MLEVCPLLLRVRLGAHWVSNYDYISGLLSLNFNIHSSMPHQCFGTKVGSIKKYI